MSSIRKIFATNQTTEAAGVWQDYGNGVEILIARAGGSNKAFAVRFAELTKPHRRLIQAEAIGDDVSKEILYRVYAETVVKDWKGVTADDLDPKAENPTEAVPYTVENCVALFKALPDLYTDIVVQSGKLALWRQVANEGDAKN